MATKKKTAVTEETAPKEMALIIRTVNAEGQSYGGFQWPKEGRVEAPDWKPTAQCGNGLHGLLDGLGDWNHLSMGEGEIVQVAEIERSHAVDLPGKVKFPFCEMKFSGSWAGAMKTIMPSMQKAVRRDIAALQAECKKEAGNYAPAATTGDNAPAATTGKHSIAASLGMGAVAKAGESGAIVLAAYGDWDGSAYPLKAVFAGMVGQTYGGVMIKAATPYRLKTDGTLAEVQS